MHASDSLVQDQSYTDISKGLISPLWYVWEMVVNNSNAAAPTSLTKLIFISMRWLPAWIHRPLVFACWEEWMNEWMLLWKWVEFSSIRLFPCHISHPDYVNRFQGLIPCIWPSHVRITHIRICLTNSTEDIQVCLLYFKLTSMSWF